MKIGLDVHGVIDIYPEIFSKLSEQLFNRGNEIHIITGQEWQVIKPKVDSYGISYTHHFSIVDYHKQQNTPMYTRSDKKGWWMEGDIWVRTKGDYASYIGIDIHFDDSYSYAKYFPKNCNYIIVPQKNFDLFYYDLLNNKSK